MEMADAVDAVIVLIESIYSRKANYLTKSDQKRMQ